MKYFLSIALTLTLFVGCSEPTEEKKDSPAEETSSAQPVDTPSTDEPTLSTANMETVVMKVPGMH